VFVQPSGKYADIVSVLSEDRVLLHFLCDFRLFLATTITSLLKSSPLTFAKCLMKDPTHSGKGWWIRKTV